eukprot:CAMPEP_0194773168 /NCGR_PEP_ID=MMETSP0323_2-20130528/54100_1 /TAXON_ID=2866 ORGANISM="Crypthecodinium cohnii, Strain Seligo" /NCGR_SAMPLE_ID=MMETSP0323_2 /ASSEMBLY_ACC=CAM_ASM_000346 /LENGTH=56 /DNA_ID=CAMNT_0039708071 /DNA_START=57 /DNA_END=224 /DNA_ORIENTATION=+
MTPDPPIRPESSMNQQTDELRKFPRGTWENRQTPPSCASPLQSDPNLSANSPGHSR